MLLLRHASYERCAIMRRIISFSLYRCFSSFDAAAALSALRLLYCSARQPAIAADAAFRGASCCRHDITILPLFTAVEAYARFTRCAPRSYDYGMVLRYFATLLILLLLLMLRCHDAAIQPLMRACYIDTLPIFSMPLPVTIRACYFAIVFLAPPAGMCAMMPCHAMLMICCALLMPYI